MSAPTPLITSAKRRRFLIFVAGMIFAVLLQNGYSVIVTIRSNMAWATEARSISKKLLSLQSAPPAEYEPEEWDRAFARFYAGFLNGCHSPETVDIESLKKFSTDLDRMLKTERSSYGLLRKIWERIGECSPAAYRLIDKHRSDFYDSLPPSEQVRAIAR